MNFEQIFSSYLSGTNGCGCTICSGPIKGRQYHRNKTEVYQTTRGCSACWRGLSKVMKIAQQVKLTMMHLCGV
jgi:hypothetical protein